MVSVSYWIFTAIDFFIMSNECCVDEINLLKERIEKLKINATALKREYQELLVENLQKDIIIRRFECKPKFSSFNNTLTESCLERLNLIGISKREDSRFITIVLEDLYRDEPYTLKNKTLSGRSKKDKKSPISPVKLKTVKSIFAERLSYISETEIDDLRRNGVSKLIRNAIDNVNREK